MELKKLEERSIKLNQIVAPNVKRIIADKCLKQCSVAKKAGYSNNQFSAMLNGRKLVKDVDVYRIASALEVDVNELFKEMEKETLM